MGSSTTERGRPAQVTYVADPEGTECAERTARALERLERTEGRWAMADAAIAHIHTQRPAPASSWLLKRAERRAAPRTRPDEVVAWARPGRRDTERERALRAVYVHHFNGLNVHHSDEADTCTCAVEHVKPRTGVRA